MSNNKKKILIVDDSSFSRLLLKRIINKSNFAEVIGEAKDGNEAVSLFEELKPDLITMNLIMPEKNGIEAIEDIMRIKRTANIIVITAIGQESVILEATLKGARDFIQKPFDEGVILDTIKKHLRA